MLNELATLRDSLERHNIEYGGAHPWVKRMGRAPTLVAGLGTSGQVHSLELLSAEEAATLFKIQRSNHSNFPGVNVDSSVWEMDESAVRVWQATPVTDIRGRVAALRIACAAGRLSKKAVEGLRRIRKDAGELQARFRTADETFAAFQALLERVLATEGSEEAWYRSLTEAALRVAESGEAKALEYVELLLGGKGEKKSKRLPLVLDVADYAQFSWELLASEEQGGEEGVCSLTGKRTVIEAGPLPRPNLPVLGPTSLMSMNPDTPCQTRYGRIGSDVFRVGKDTATELNAALVGITAADREFKTWQRLPGQVKGKSNLLVVFLRAAPFEEAELASFFSEPEEAERTYTALCADLAKSLTGRESYANDRLEILVLNKISPGQVQVELSRSVPAAQVVEGGRAWEEAGRNLPETVFRRWPEVPFPSEVARLTQQQWIRGGRETADAAGCPLGQVYDVLVGDAQGAGAAARALLELVLRRATPLLAAVAHAYHRGGKEAWKGFARGAQESGSVAVAVLAATLQKLGRSKEDYMQGPAYQLGRFLSLADTLHREYCGGVREGQIPPQLLGNSMLPTVVTSPKKGLAQMINRLRVYRAWAEKAGSGLARWSVAEMGKLSPSLAERLPGRLGDEEKAELLLGYLARAEKKQEGDEGRDE